MSQSQEGSMEEFLKEHRRKSKGNREEMKQKFSEDIYAGIFEDSHWETPSGTPKIISVDFFRSVPREILGLTSGLSNG